MMKDVKSRMGMEEKELYLRTGYYLVELIRAVLTETTPGPMPARVTAEALYQIAKKHSVDCIAYEGAKKIPGDVLGTIDVKWAKRSTQCAMQGIVQLAERNKLYQTFSKAGIRILPLKGCLIKEMYPRQEFRQMADMDILIDPENAKAAKKLMEEAGYELEGGVLGRWVHDEYVKKPWCSVELHNALLPAHNRNAKAYDDIWERAYEENPGSGIYVLTWDDFYIYILEHFAKHLRKNGSGIRSIMDIYIFNQYKGDQLNQDYLKKQLKKQDLWDFKENVELIAEAWFEKGITGVSKETEDLIILSGAYGTELLHYQQEQKQLNKKYRSKTIVKFIWLWKKVFKNMDFMTYSYPILKKCPFLLPFCWIHRIFKIVFKERSKITKNINIIKRAEKE